MTSEAGPAAVTVLVVDDSEPNRALARATLEDEGYRVVLAPGGASGVEAFARERPDCVLMDANMPEVDGFEACRRIRGLPQGGDSAILFVTAQRDLETFEEALRAGADDFLTKPVSPANLLVRVQAALRLRRLSVEVREHVELVKRHRDDLYRLRLQTERLMAFVVHDLKNPVNAIDLHAQLLQRDKSASAAVLESAADIRSETAHLNRMILNLLDIAKAEEGKLVATPVEIEIPELLKGVAAELQGSATSRGVRLEQVVQIERARADEALIHRILSNLMENAIRHAPRGSVVSITASGGVGGVEIRVRDEGPGVPGELRDRIFDPFVQAAEGADRFVTRSGRGLGLAFCKLAVEAHGGAIWLEDATPGAIFCLRLPDGD